MDPLIFQKKSIVRFPLQKWNVYHYLVTMFRFEVACTTKIILLLASKHIVIPKNSITFSVDVIYCFLLKKFLPGNNRKWSGLLKIPYVVLSFNSRTALLLRLSYSIKISKSIFAWSNTCSGAYTTIFTTSFTSTSYLKSSFREKTSIGRFNGLFQSHKAWIG